MEEETDFLVRKDYLCLSIRQSIKEPCIDVSMGLTLFMYIHDMTHAGIDETFI